MAVWLQTTSLLVASEFDLAKIEATKLVLWRLTSVAVYDIIFEYTCTNVCK